MVQQCFGGQYFSVLAFLGTNKSSANCFVLYNFITVFCHILMIFVYILHLFIIYLAKNISYECNKIKIQKILLFFNSYNSIYLPINSLLYKCPWTPSLDNVIATKSTILLRNSHKQVAPTFFLFKYILCPRVIPKCCLFCSSSYQPNLHFFSRSHNQK